MPSQTKIISSVNRLFREKDWSVHLDEGGICANLVGLLLWFCLMGSAEKNLQARLDEFFHLSKRLANPPKGYKIGMDENLDKFILNIETIFHPCLNNEKNVGDWDKVLTIEGAFVKNEYNLGFVDTAVEWTKILEQMHHNGRVCYVGANSHAIGLIFADDLYIIFDPNYARDDDEINIEKGFNIKVLNSAAAAIAELASRFSYTTENIGLSIRVFAEPNADMALHYPNKQELWARRLKEKSDFTRKTLSNYKTLDFAILANDTETMHYHLKQNEVDRHRIIVAIYWQRNDFVWRYFLSLEGFKTQWRLLTSTVQDGANSLLKKMLEKLEENSRHDEQAKNNFDEAIEAEPSLLELAIAPNNLSNFLEIIEFYKRNSLEIDTFGLEVKLLHFVTKSGTAQVIHALLPLLKPLATSYILYLAKKAAENDNHSTLQFWLDQLKTKTVTVNELVIDVKIISKISPINLQLLITHGFSIPSSLFAHALRRHGTAILSMVLKQQEINEWTLFLQKAIDNQPIDNCLEQIGGLFQDHEGVSAYEVLARLGKTNLISAHWTASLVEEEKEKALEFACQYGSEELVSFLVDKGCDTSESFKLDQLKLALRQGDMQRVNTILASKINNESIFNAKTEDYQLINHLLELEKYHFVIDTWSTLSDSQKKYFFLRALTLRNAAFIKAILQKSEYLCFAIIWDKMEYAFTSQPLLLDEIAPFWQLIEDERLAFFIAKAQRLKGERGKTVLEFVLKDVILNHSNSFATKLATYISLTDEQYYELFIEAVATKNRDALQFLSMHQGDIFSRSPVYERIKKEGRQDILDIAYGSVKHHLEFIEEKVVVVKINDLKKLRESLAHQDWSAVLTFISAYKKEELDDELMQTLRAHEWELMKALEAHSRQELPNDPRHMLNALLSPTDENVLSLVLQQRHDEIKALLISIQAQMKEKQIDLKRHFYDFELYDQIKAQEALQSRITQLLKNNPYYIVREKRLRDELLSIKEMLDKNKLIPSYFDDGETLVELFNAFDHYEKREKPIESLKQVIYQYKLERFAEGEVFLPFFQYTQKDKLEAASDFLDAWSYTDRLIPEKKRSILNNGRLASRINEFLATNKEELKQALQCEAALNSVNELIDFLNGRNPIGTLIGIAKDYQRHRAKEKDSYVCWFFRCYTKQDEIAAAQGFIELLTGKNQSLAAKDLAILQQSTLGHELLAYIKKYNTVLEKELTRQINNVEELVNFCSSSEYSPLISVQPSSL